jgi:hypothetical protein
MTFWYDQIIQIYAAMLSLYYMTDGLVFPWVLKHGKIMC